MTGLDFLFQLFSLLLGLAVAELLVGLGRSWRIASGATLSHARVRIGWLVPLLGLLLLIDQMHFWVSAHALKDHVEFGYGTLLIVLAIIGGYFVLSTFVFPDDPADWPDFDAYYLKTNRIILGGMFLVNLGTIGFLGLLLSRGAVDPAKLPFAQNLLSLSAVFLYFPGLIALWFVKSPAANRLLLILMIALLLTGAVAQFL